MMGEPRVARRPPVFPPLTEVLGWWHRADEAFLRARCRVERGSIMVEQLRARCVIHRLSEIELLIQHPLRAMLVEEGVWSPREALDRLDLVDFAALNNALRALAPVLPPEWLGRALEMVTRPGWGDDARWEVDEELVQALTDRMTRASEYGREPEAMQAVVVIPRDVVPHSAAARGSDVLAHILFRGRTTGRDLWTQPWFGRLLKYVEDDNLYPEHFDMAAELAQDRKNPLCGELRRALLASGRELWSKPWFRRVFDAEERREHLRRVVELRERREVPCFNALLQIAQRLPPASRTTVLRWAVEQREERGGEQAPLDLARAAAFCEGEERAALLARIETWFEELEVEEPLATLTALMKGATPAEALALARRGLGWIATADAPQWSDATRFLESISSSTWRALARTDWEPALKAGGRNWVSYDVRLLALPNVSEEVRRFLEERALPVLLEEEARVRLETGARIIQALSPVGRARLIASLLPLDAATWRKAAAAVGRIARHLADDDIERLCRTLHAPDPEGKWLAEKGLAEAWAARGEGNCAAAIIERITDDAPHVEAQVAVAIAAGDASALLSLLSPSLPLQLYGDAVAAVVRWASERGDSTVADTLGARLNEHLSAPDRLDAWAALWPALSAHARTEFVQRSEFAVEAVLAEDNLRDDALCAIAEVLPKTLLERIWMARASASAYRHALALFENRFCEFMLPDNHRHPCALRFVQALGGEEALFEHARSLAGLGPRPS